MCGIAGILRITPGSALGDPASRRRALSRTYEEAIPEAWLDLLDADIRHRGPDGQGRFRDRALRADGSVADVAFVHRRLSIIDHAGGGQPMVSLRGFAAGGKMDGVGAGGERGAGASASDVVGRPPPLLFHGRPRDAVDYAAVPAHDGDNLVATVFNGCVYNHRELRAALVAGGARFASDHSDTEVLLHAWRAWRGSLFPRLDAMYALALWDRAAGTLVLARDEFGEKPLYKVDLTDRSEGMLAFSSGAAGLCRLLPLIQESGARAQLDLPSLRGWVRFGWGQMSPFQEVQPALIGSPHAWPAEALQQKGGSGWWFASLNPSNREVGAPEVEAALARSVASRLEADVPLGCFLSGGVDSALVASFAAQARPDMLAFTVRMPDAEHDESPAAAATARALGVRHEILDCRASPAEDLVRLIGQLGLPFGDSSLLPTHWVSRAARARVAVALSGDGGDDLFLGYDRHRAMKAMAWATRLPREAWRAIADAPLADGRARSWRTKLWRLASAAAGCGYKDLLAIFPCPLDEELGLGDQWAHRGWRHLGLVSTGWETIDFQQRTQLRLDRMFYLPEDLMRKSDTASMSVALEVRSPFLARGLAELAMNATVESLMPRGERKGLLRQIARRRLPGAIVDAPKRGFAIPIGEWFRSDFGGMRTLLMDRMSSREPFGAVGAELGLNMNCVRRMIDEHMRGERDHAQRLYMLVVLAVWGSGVGG